ncbi:hypothetical protein AB4E19_09755 [Clostridioides difficile]|nr:hypothetical protein [Clostridioides difficile]MDO0130422.1 hypothetical protein [Clostridioides difficile]
MDKITYEILKLLNKNDSLNTYQFEVLLNVKGFENYYPRLKHLYDNNYVYIVNAFDNSDEFKFKYESYFKITLEGKAFIENEMKNNKKFKIQSIYIPILIAFITSLFTNLIALWLLK